MKVLVLSLGYLALASTALAGGPHDSAPPSEELTAVAGAAAAAESNSLGLGVGVGVGGNSNASATGGNARQHQGQAQGQKQSASSDQALSFSDSSKYISLGFDAANSDPGTTAECTESRRGWGFFGAGASGRTRINEDCARTAQSNVEAERNFSQCIELVRMYLEVGAKEAAMGQLTACGGRSFPVAVAEIRKQEVAEERPVVDPGTATKEYVNEVVHRVFAATQQK